ncbi:MAG: hypothetical protein A2283_11750 [Lentisphaerae bacterium RIFOXYA12_FULL_48_11]|nr:MAG: hypothetical protein A2259_01365 [Candidatus Moranbacteria bacterium RIFOXYA2_FULL_43_15]OGV66612.1 MAG: hypothetical protein A2283_11750 [Lentisphaerae bacterium RIFOXYA12_FULL_48_11]
MKKLGTYLLYGGALFFAIALVYISVSPGKKTGSSNANTGVQESSSKEVEAEKTKPAEKIQIFIFHATQRCVTCVNIGKYAQKTVEQKFPEELKSGKIEFREINIDLSENKELATKFKASGSALFINPIIDGRDNIKEDTQVWRLTSNEQTFSSYLSDKLNSML